MKLLRISTNIFRSSKIKNHRSVTSLSGEYYTSEKLYEIERKSILGSSWQCEYIYVIIYNTYHNYYFKSL
jgi:hypothetical protein